MAKQITVVVTDKTDFKKYNALELGDIIHFDGRGEYEHPDGSTGLYEPWWLELMLETGCFEEVVEDDELPPAPDRVAYWEERGLLNNSATLNIAPSGVMDGLCFRISTVDHNTGRTADVAMRLGPDDILKLVHDLRRMAMDIKRKQKQEQEQAQ